MTAALMNVPFKPDTWYMEVPRCDTCRWWDAGNSREGTCLRTDHAGALAMPFPTNADSAADAGLQTAPDFGCVQWEAKSDE
jgi:hypothetical protein